MIHPGKQEVLIMLGSSDSFSVAPSWGSWTETAMFNIEVLWSMSHTFVTDVL